jgi:MSHA pilin protein MshD
MAAANPNPFEFLRSKNQSGGSLIEIVISIVILSLALLALIYLFLFMSKGIVTAQYRSTATYLARDLMEEILSRRFDEKVMKTDEGSGPVWSSTGVDTGENSANKNTFDDVDDFNGRTDTPLTGYTRTVTVFYVNSGNLNQQVTISATQQDYKRISVVVSKGGTNYAELVTLKAPLR